MELFFWLLIFVWLIVLTVCVIAKRDNTYVCRKNRAARHGPTGAIGATGAAGARGSAGMAGATGSVGPTGPVSVADAAPSYRAIQPIFLSSSVTGYAGTTDIELIGAWGLAIDPSTVTENSIDFWLASNGTNITQGYVQKNRYSFALNTGAAGFDPVLAGEIEVLEDISDVRNPSGVAVNLSPAAFPIAHGGVTGPASIVVVTEGGRIYAHNSQVYAGLLPMVTVTGANYKGCAILGSTLYVANWRTASVDMYNSAFQHVRSFSDPDSTLMVVNGYSIFNVAAINGSIFASVAYSDGGSEPTPGPGNGFIDIFTPAGAFVRRFVSRGMLNAPWAMQFVPAARSGSGQDEVLVGNNGDGTIGRYLFDTGSLLSKSVDQCGNTLTLDHVFGIALLPFTPSQALFAGAVSQYNEGVLGVAVEAPQVNPNFVISIPMQTEAQRGRIKSARALLTKSSRRPIRPMSS